MNKKRLIIEVAVMLGMSGMSAQAAVLNAGDVLAVGVGSWFAVDLDYSMTITASETAAIAPGADGGVRIGNTQTIGAIDAPWTWFSAPGNHYTSVAPTGGTTSGIDFSGWSIYWDGAPVPNYFDYGAWTPTNCATLGCTGVSFVADTAAFTWSGVYGDTYGLWYSWSFLSGAGAFEPTLYLLHLEGTVQAIPEASTYAMMLAGLGLVGFAARRRRLVRADRRRLTRVGFRSSTTGKESI